MEKVALLDTDFAFEYYNNNYNAIQAISSQNFSFIVLSTITVSEIIRACKDKRTLQKSIQLLSGEEFLFVNETISQKSLLLLQQYSLSHNLDISDSLIAATAIYYNLHLATCNTKHFSYIPSLKIINHTVQPKRKGGSLF